MGQLYDSYQAYKQLISKYRNERNMSAEQARKLAFQILDGKKEVIKK